MLIGLRLGTTRAAGTLRSTTLSPMNHENGAVAHLSAAANKGCQGRACTACATAPLDYPLFAHRKRSRPQPV